MRVRVRACVCVKGWNQVTLLDVSKSRKTLVLIQADGLTNWIHVFLPRKYMRYLSLTHIQYENKVNGLQYVP